MTHAGLSAPGLRGWGWGKRSGCMGPGWGGGHSGARPARAAPAASCSLSATWKRQAGGQEPSVLGSPSCSNRRL